MSVWNELGDGVFRRRYEALDQNIGLILSSEEVVIIDTRSHHVHADELKADIRKLTKLPITTVINTHMHWDHAFGNARFPESRVIGHVRCRSRLIDDGERMRNATITNMPEEWAQPLGDVEIVPPDTTFQETMTFDVDDRTVSLAYHGRGHTDNDIIVIIDDVLFAGDLIEHGAPPAFGDSYPAEWPTTLDSILTETASVWVPGHGDVVDREFVRNQLSHLGVVAALLAERAASGADCFPPGPYPVGVMEQAWARRSAS